MLENRDPIGPRKRSRLPRRGPIDGVRARGPAFLLAAASIALLPGCGTLLTQQQADAIRGFSRANASYSTLPSSVLRAYEEVHFTARVLGASTTTKQNAARAADQIDEAVHFWQAIEANAVQLDAALAVFDRYSALLVGLVSDKLDNLDNTAADLGNAFEGSVNAYNQLPAGRASPLPSLGSDVAAGARALGGAFVRNRQLAYLREFVRKADPVIAKLTADVGSLIDSFIGPNGNFTADATGVEATLRMCLAGCPVALGPADVQLFAEVLRKEALAVSLAEKVRDASVKLASSHKALAAVLAPSPSIAEARAEIDSLVGQVQAAAKVKSKLDNPALIMCGPGG